MAAGPSRVRALASVTVLEAHDVVLAEIRARLHLDDLEHYGAGVLDTVLHADRDVGGLVLLEEELFLAARDARGARDHHPMLGAVVMHLQRQLRAGLDLEALHLEARSRLDAVVAPPGAEHLAVQRMLVAAALLELRHQLLHVLHARLGRHQHRVLGLDYDVVPEADSGYQPAFGIQIVARGVLADDVAVRHVAVNVAFNRLGKRRPGADVAPPGRERHHHRGVGLLHHGVVDRVRRAGGEALGGYAREFQIGARGTESRRAHARDLRREARELGQVAARAEHEHAAVPVVFPRLHELRGALRIGLLDEARDAVQRPARLAPLDVAVTALGRGRHDPERDQLPLLRGRQR